MQHEKTTKIQKHMQHEHLIVSSIVFIYTLCLFIYIVLSSLHMKSYRVYLHIYAGKNMLTY